MQVDRIKPTLKAPGTNRLTLKYDEPLSDVAIKFNLRRYVAEPSTAMTVTVLPGSTLANPFRCSTPEATVTPPRELAGSVIVVTPVRTPRR